MGGARMFTVCNDLGENVASRRRSEFLGVAERYGLVAASRISAAQHLRQTRESRGSLSKRDRGVTRDGILGCFDAGRVFTPGKLVMLP